MSSFLDRLVSVRALFVLSGLFILYATTLPFDFSHAPTLARAELIPLWDPVRGRLASIPDLVQNVVLFMPFGFFAVRSFPRMQGHVARTTVLAGLLGFVVSGTVETLQTMSSIRTPSASDLTTNTLGCALGGLVAHLWGAHLVGWTNQRIERVRAVQPGLLVVAGLLLIVGFTLLAPFIPTLDVGAMRAQVRSVIDHPFGTRPPGASVPSMVLFAALGFAVAREVPSRLLAKGGPLSSVSAAGVGAAIAVVLAVGFELAQMPLLFHRPSLLDLAANAMGGTMGALAVVLVERGGNVTPEPRLGTWSARWPTLVLAICVLAPVTRALSPFVTRPVGPALEALDPTYLVPFLHFFDTMKLSTFLNVFETAATYLPLGYVLAARRVSPALAFGLAVALAEVLELSQIAIESRSVDVTEGLLAAAGALAGRAVALRLGAVRDEAPGSPLDLDGTRPVALRAPR